MHILEPSPGEPRSGDPTAVSNRAYLKLLIEHSPIAIVLLNSSHRVIECNPTFERVFGYSLRELIDRNFDELIAGEDFLYDAKRYTAAVLQGEKVRIVTRRRRKDGTWIDVEIHGIPLVVDGVLEGVYGLYIDISERTRAESSLRRLSRELMQLQENEKRKIARELHDATSQELALLSMKLSKLQRKLPQDNLELMGLMREIRGLTRQCTQKIRGTSYLLHPPLLQEAGLAPAISWLADGFAERTGIPVNVRIPASLGRLDDVVELAVFRIVQESLSNVLRHSKSKVVDIEIYQGSRAICLSIENRASGRSPSRINGKRTPKAMPQSDLNSYQPGVGIAGMRERLTQLGGTLDVHLTPRGMTVVASLPVEVQASA